MNYRMYFPELRKARKKATQLLYVLKTYGTISQMVKTIDKDLLYNARYTRMGRGSFLKTLSIY